MAEERLSYTIPAAPAGEDGSQVSLDLTYDPASTDASGYVTVTAASGTYQTVDGNGAVIDTDTVTGLAQSGGSFGNPDNKLFIGAGSPYVTNNGITYNISNATDSNDNMGAVNFSTPDGQNYYEGGSNPNPASTVSEAAVTCFGSGTLIRTTVGDVAVEDLTIGAVAVTSSGSHRPIRWLGHRVVDCRYHPRPQEIMPVRISAHAFGENRPARDLMVSPGHSLCVDVVGEVLIPAAALINGSTVVQDDVESVTYWHVELETHEIILAENMPVESYLDMGNRSFFAESALVSLDASPEAPVPTHADFCRPFHAEGALVSAVRAQLSARASALGWRLETNRLEDVHLDIDGVRTDPQVRGLTIRFDVPRDAREVSLISATSKPATIGDSNDQRQLGSCIRALIVDDGFGQTRSVEIDDPLLCVGFHAVERDGDLAWRWTAGRALLPASLWGGVDGDFFLRVQLASPMLPRWVAPIPVFDDVREHFALRA